MERLYDTKEAGQRIGKVSPAGVRELVHSGKLRARVQHVRERDPNRKRKPQLYITESEIQRYIAALPEWKREGERKKRQPKTPAGVRSEVTAVVQYE